MEFFVSVRLAYNHDMITPTYTYELKLLKDYRFIAGIDEVGRGPLAGPIVAAVVILKPEKVGINRSKSKWWAGVRDSKTLSADQRSSLVDFIKENSYDFGIGQATNGEIDELNIHYASLLAMKRAVENLALAPDILFIDGKFGIPHSKFRIQTIIDGDAHVLSIAAASVLAKVYRDDLMIKLSEKFSQFGFESHKGYNTQFHRKKLLFQGPCEIHRMTFEAVKNVMNERFYKML